MDAAPQLEPLSYHRAVVEHLTEYEPEIWRWASSQETRGEQVREMQALLLRQTYRLDPEAHPEIYEDCRAVLATLVGVDDSRATTCDVTPLSDGQRGNGCDY